MKVLQSHKFLFQVVNIFLKTNVIESILCTGNKKILKALFFRAISYLQWNWEEDTKVIYILPVHTCIASPIISIPHKSGIFITINEPTLTNQIQPNSIVYTMVHFWCWMFIWINV